METVDFDSIKVRQKATWASGNYSVIGSTLQIVGEQLCEAVDLRAGAQVLDVCAGNGNATLAAARRGGVVTSTDYVGALLDAGRERARAEGWDVTFAEADVEKLPFADGSFDTVLSTFGVMFAPNHAAASTELVRVCRPGGRIALANWTPEGFIGKLFKLVGRRVPPPRGVAAPVLWGNREHLEGLFAGRGEVHVEKRLFSFRYRSPEHFVDVFCTFYGPLHRAFGVLDPEPRAEFQRELVALVREHNRSNDETVVVPSEYLEVVVKTRLP